MNNVKNRITALMLVAAAAGHASAVDKSWFAASGTWSTVGNWTPVGVPNPGDAVYIGNLPVARNATVTLNNTTTIAGLSITDGMTLNTSLSRLTVAGPTTVSGSNLEGVITYRSRLSVGQSALPSDCVLENLTVSSGANIDINDGATMDVSGVFNLQDTATLSADGIVNLSWPGATAMIVNGSIAISPSATGLVINQNGAGRVDLDGTVADGREINITARRGDGSQFAKLTINGDQLSDAFSEVITLGGRNSLAMNLSNGWTMDPASQLHIQGSASFPGPSNVYGSELTIQGTVRVSGTDAEGRIYAPVVLDPLARIELNADTLLDFNGDTTINGGSVEVDAGGRVRFVGDTTWNGNVTLSGTVQQNGDATVSGATTINAGRFDMDGSSLPVWTVNAPLIVNAEALDSIGSKFDGTMNVTGPSSRVEIHLANPADYWSIGGEMNATAPMFIAATRIAGSPVRVQGTLNASGRVRIDADARWVAGSTTNMGTASTECILLKDGLIDANAAFAGGGYVSVASTGHLTLANSANLGNTGVRNDGVVSVGPDAGSATARGFSQSASGTLDVQIGGNAPGVDSDVLFVNGPSGAELAGNLSVSLLSPGGAPFIPDVGDQFLVISSSSVSGTFAGVADSSIGGWTVEWTAVYGPNAVWVRAANVYQTCPADFNQDGFVDFFDYEGYVACFEDGVCPLGKSADFNGDGFVDFFDFNDFVAAFEAGC